MEPFIAIAIVACIVILAIVVHTGGNRVRIRTEFSDVIVQDEGHFRMLFFVSERGERALESAMDRRNPARLVLAYTRMMMACHLVCPHIDRSLLLGLGGGSMVKFINRYFPDMKLDVVEIDPEIERIAKVHFDMHPGDNTRIFLEDGRSFLERSQQMYDAIHLDAFLQASAGTDTLGVGLRMKESAFYDLVRNHLTEEGVAVFNLNQSIHMEDDIRTIGSSFASIYRFSVPGLKHQVLIACKNETPITGAGLMKKAAEMTPIPELDFLEMANHLIE